MGIVSELETHGWGKHAFVGENGEFCLGHALCVAYKVPNRYNIAWEFVIALAVERGYRNVVHFNDAPETTYEDVHLVAKLTDVEMGL